MNKKTKGVTKKKEPKYRKYQYEHMFMHNKVIEDKDIIDEEIFAEGGFEEIWRRLVDKKIVYKKQHPEFFGIARWILQKYIRNFIRELKIIEKEYNIDIVGEEEWKKIRE